MKKDSLVIIGSLMAAAAVVFFLIMPGFDALSFSRDAAAAEKARIERIKAFDEKIKKLSEEYEADPEAGEKLLATLPKEQELAQLLIQLEKLATANNLIMEAVDFSDISENLNPSLPVPVGIGGDEALPGQGAMTEPGIPMPGALIQPPQIEAANSYKTLSVKLKLNGGYEAFKNYLKAVEENERLMDVMALGYSGGQDANTLYFTVDLYVYYQ